MVNNYCFPKLLSYKLRFYAHHYHYLFEVHGQLLNYILVFWLTIFL